MALFQGSLSRSGTVHACPQGSGGRVSLWQTPNIGEGNILLDEACAKRYLAPMREEKLTTASDFSGQDFGGQIDFTNSAAEAWAINDQFLCGADILVAPVLNESGWRSVYLPCGEWVDFWSGNREQGGHRLPAILSPLGQIPLYFRAGAVIPYYPYKVDCTDEMAREKIALMEVDKEFRGIAGTALGRLCGFR